MNEAVCSEKRGISKWGQQRPCETVHKQACFFLFAALFRRVRECRQGEAGSGVNNMQLRYMTQIKNSV